MDFEWDIAKDAANIAKHGVSLGDAMRLDWNVGVTISDNRQDYGELRYTRFSQIDGRLYTCTFAWRERAVRIISLRKSNKREIRKYGQGIPDTNYQ
jgi:uncharacterized protein